MISITDIQISFAGVPVLQGVDLNIQEGECLAIVGPNGCGKSTLLRVIAGIEHPEKGEIRLPNRATVDYLPQESDLNSDRSLQDELIDAFVEVRAALAEMETLETRMAETTPESAEHERVMKRYAECTHVVERQDGYSLENQVRRVAAGLGFKPEDMARSCREFSGGWQMRILLAKFLLRKPDVLLLDEPTNHLDLESTLWLENWIKTCDRTVLLVSHERATMDRLADRIVCLGQGTAEVYPGDYTKYLEKSQEKRDAQWKAFERQKREIESTEAFIRRFRYTASRAALVQSRVKQLAKIERITPPFHPTAIHFKFPEAPESYTEVLTLENLGHSYGDNRVLKNLNLTIRRGEKVGLVGVNGAGKSTLLRILVGKERPTQGDYLVGGRVRSIHFAQYDTSTLSSEATLLEAIEEGAPTGEAGRSRDLLGAFLFHGDDAQKPLRVLSGGERTRFRLAQMLFSPANLLLLDEPTNHLDITSRATVEEALRAYTGTVVVVSHDRVFMDRVTNRIIEIEDGNATTYPGSYGAYVRYKEAQAAEQEADTPTAAPVAKAAALPVTEKQQRMQSREERKAQARLLRQTQKRVERAEADIEKLEARIEELEQTMADPELAADYDRLAPVAQERRDTQTQLQEKMEEWESLHEELEALEAEE